MLDARVVDQDIAAARAVDQRAAIVAQRHVGGDVGDGAPGLGGKRRCQRVILGPVGERVQHDIRPRRRQRPRDAKPDARG